MVGPAKRRAATAHVMTTFGVSQRRACRVLGTSRSSQRRGDPPLRAAVDVLRQRLRDLARQRPRYGYRRLCALLRAEGLEVNHKRAARLWLAYGCTATLGSVAGSGHPPCPPTG